MQHSLFSRFQGCLWGIVLGERFGHSKSEDGFRHYKRMPLPYEQRSLSQDTNTSLSDAAFQVLEAIVQAQTWNMPVAQKVAQRLDRTNLHNFSGGMWAIVALPLTLLFHDDLTLQRQALRQLIDVAQVNEVTGYAGMLYAYTIAQATKGQLTPRLLIDQSQAYLRVTVPESSEALPHLLAQLEQIQQLQASETDFFIAIQALQTSSSIETSIAIALYCFLQTPHSFQLALSQAVQVKNDCVLICALTAALSGTYNSLAGIPAAWSTTELTDPKNSLLNQFHQSGMQLLALWSGVYDASNITEVDQLAVVAPWVLRLK